ncbi:MAG: glycoside hydrolase family 97 protein [Sedimentisphaerales bacterium]|nr:glycoside hydrolase family 97 protein [Sedimentisphaerales bacterium]
MKFIKGILFLFVFVISAANAAEVTSPNEKIKVVLELQNESQPKFVVSYSENQKTTEILPSSLLGLKTKSQEFSELTLISESNVTLVHDDYEMLHGKKKHCENFGAEKTLRFKNASDKCIDIVFRVYNDGVAFRYILCDYDTSLNSITEELTAYTIPDGTERWIQPYNEVYEALYPVSTNTRANSRWGYPALFKMADNVFMLITEADISRQNYASSLIAKDNTTYQVTKAQNDRDGNQFTIPWQSPWRILIIGQLSDIVESTLVTDVSAPCKLSETDWIKPGSSSWIYWANNHGTKDYKKLVEYVDLAAEMGWPYTLIDWEWDQMGNGGTITDIVKYAKSKGVKPLMWYNSGTSWMGPTPNDRMNTQERRVKEFEWLNQIGVYGIKVDFFPGDQQKTMNHYISILEDAARYKLMVNFHGCTLPRGWTRTYPNLMTMEGVYGAEQYNNGRRMTPQGASHNATLPYTRNAVGPMDYTPVAFTNSQNPHTTSYAHELALSVVFESGIVHFADRPSGFTSLPEKAKEFLRNVPTAWDNTKLLDGSPGQLTVMARQKAGNWYIGAINGEDMEKTINVNFGFLQPNIKYKMVLIKDGDNRSAFEISNRDVNNNNDIEIKLLPKGGAVIWITKDITR